jgi:hypothetical protein
MKALEIIATKGQSTIFCEVAACDTKGVYTEDPAAAKTWICSLGGSCGIHSHGSRAEAEAELRNRIGDLVLRGYKVELAAK